MNLSPFDMKNLLHHILSGKEFGVERSGEFVQGFFVPTCITKIAKILGDAIGYSQGRSLDCAFTLKSTLCLVL